MDTLVAQYSKPMFEKENYSQDDQMELYQPAPSLSLRFAMPPVAQVYLPSPLPILPEAPSAVKYGMLMILFNVALSLAPSSDRRQCQS